MLCESDLTSNDVVQAIVSRIDKLEAEMSAQIRDLPKRFMHHLRSKEAGPLLKSELPDLRFVGKIIQNMRDENDALEVGTMDAATKVNAGNQEALSKFSGETRLTVDTPQKEQNSEHEASGWTGESPASVPQTPPKKNDDAILEDSIVIPTEQEASKSAQGRMRSSDLQALHKAMGWMNESNTELMAGHLFQAVSATVILLNAVVIGMEADAAVSYEIGRELHKGGDGPPVEKYNQTFYTVVEIGTAIWMLFEVGANMIHQGCQKFWKGPDRAWNIFDFSVLALSVLDLLVTMATSSGAVGLSFLRVVRLLRMGKSVRLFRVIKFLRRVRSMFIAMAGSFVPLLWALVLMVIIMYSTSIVIMQLVAFELESQNGDRRLASTEMIQDTRPSDGLGHERHLASIFSWSLRYTPTQALDQLYGSLGRSIITLFRSLIGGVDFDHATHPLAQLNIALVILYLLYLAFMIFGVLNVLTGIFCDAAIAAAQSDRANVIQAQMEDDAALMTELKDIFAQSDTDGSGKVSQDEFDVLLQNEEVAARFEAIGISCTEAEGLIKLLDNDGSGEVDVDEFMSGCLRITGGAKAVDMVTLLYENKKIMMKMREVQDVLERIDGVTIKRHRSDPRIKQGLTSSGSMSKLVAVPHSTSSLSKT